MVNFFAFILLFADDGTLAGHMAAKEPYSNFDSCMEVISETLTKNSKYPMPEGVVKVTGVCLPVPTETQVSE